jgi:hypothetical protein
MIISMVSREGLASMESVIVSNAAAYRALESPIEVSLFFALAAGQNPACKLARAFCVTLTIDSRHCRWPPAA